MPNLYDGSDDELTLGQALVILARHSTIPSEAVKNDVILAFQRAHDLVPPPPDVLIAPLDARDTTLRQQDEELALLRAELARRNQRDAKLEENETAIRDLRAQLGGGAPAPAQPAAPAPVADPVAALQAQVAQLTSFIAAHGLTPAAPGAPDPRDAELAARATP